MGRLYSVNEAGLDENFVELVLEDRLGEVVVAASLSSDLFEPSIGVGRQEANERLLDASVAEVVSNGCRAIRPVKDRHAKVNHDQAIHRF